MPPFLSPVDIQLLLFLSRLILGSFFVVASSWNPDRAPQHVSWSADARVAVSGSVNAAFRQTLWSVAPVSSGTVEAQGTSVLPYYDIFRAAYNHFTTS